MHISRRAFGKLLLSTSVLALTSQRAAAYSLVSRSDWGAKPPAFDMVPHQPRRITIHHTGVPAKPARDLEDKMRSLQRFSQSTEKLADGRTKKAWADIPYHFYIGAGGRVAEGRPLEFAGDTNTNYDPATHIGIAVEGNFNKAKPTPEQIDALVELISDLKSRFDIDLSNVSTHQDFAQTACPGSHMIAMLPSILNRVG